MGKIIVELSEERLITPSGLSLVGVLLGKSDFVKRCNRTTVSAKRSQPQIKSGDILLTYIGLLCQGKTDFESVKEMEEDPECYNHWGSPEPCHRRKHCGSEWTELETVYARRS